MNDKPKLDGRFYQRDREGRPIGPSNGGEVASNRVHVRNLLAGIPGERGHPAPTPLPRDR